MTKIQLQTPEGVREVKCITGSAEFDAARDAGEIAIGEEIVYKNKLVQIIDGYGMLLLDTVQGAPFMGGFTGGMPDMGGFSGIHQDGARWSFTVNGQPVNPEQMEEFMRGGQVGK